MAGDHVGRLISAHEALRALNARSEVPFGPDQSTTVPGLFAAGDVTDEREKQITVAAGAGAKAALAAHRYLRLTREEATETETLSAAPGATAQAGHLGHH